MEENTTLPRLVKIDPHTWPILSHLLDEWLDLAPEARSSWLENLGPEYADVLPALRELIASWAGGGDDMFLNTLPTFANSVAGWDGFAAGALIGPYRLLRELGRGGMGMVWLAERADGSLKRPVALKLPMLSLYPGLSERFARERDILGQLIHPHIARLYDAGIADGIQPYLAIEYVDGEAITVHCDRRRLPIQSRLRLFLDAMSAVQYAHANLVIHRDLKPSNIFVTNEGQVRLLDFGIAKLLHEGRAQETELTRLSGRAFTPDYASPEQIAGDPVTTAGDVYSLGVVLFELLSGGKPYQLKRATPGALEEAILTADPEPPSRAVKDEERAQTRKSSVRALARDLRGDLDAIVLKALQKQPHQRFATVDAFAEDVQRYLNGDAVLAQPQSIWYRAGKFVIRHKLGVAAAGLAVAALSVGLSVALWEAHVARVQTRTAQEAQAFLEDIFHSNSNKNADPIKARQTTARQLLDMGAKRLDGAFREAPAAKVSMAATIGELYADLGLREESYQMFRARADLAKTVYGPYHQETAAALVELALNIGQTRHINERKAVIEEAGRILDRNRDYASLTRARWYAAATKEYILYDSGKALEASRHAVRLLRQLPLSQDLADDLRDQAMVQLGRDDYSAGIASLTEAASVARSLGEKAQDSLPSIYARIADASYITLDWSAAEKEYRRALETTRSLFGEEYQAMIQVQFRMAYFQVQAGKPVEGLELFSKAVDLALRTKGPDDVTYTGEALLSYGEALRTYGRPEEALNAFRRANGIYQRANRTSDKFFAQILDGEAACQVQLGRYAEAAKLFEASSGIYRRSGGLSGGRELSPRAQLLMATGREREANDMMEDAAPHFSNEVVMSNYRLLFNIVRAETEVAVGSYDQARRVSAEMLGVVERNPSRASMGRFESTALLVEGKALMGAGRAADALPLIERSVSLGGEVYDPQQSLVLADTEVALGQCLAKLGDTERARALLAQAKRIHAAHRSVGEQFVRPLRRLESNLR